MKTTTFATILALALSGVGGAFDDVWDQVRQGFVDSNGVKIHYATMGKGPVVVMIHGFPDFWYTWRAQMAGLADSYQVVAIDQRGYNLSDKPQGQQNYDLALLVDDLRAVVRQFTSGKATIVGHDWGGLVAWTFAMRHPELTDRLIILNLPHPRGLRHQLAHDPQQQSNASYARRFQQPDAAKSLTPEGLANRVKDPAIKSRYIAAFKNSDFEAMLNYYKQNYPREPYQEDTSPLIKIHAPVLMFHGLKDTALLAPALNNTWEWLENDLTLVTVPTAGHWVQDDAADLVTRTMKAWLALQAAKEPGS